MTLTAFQFQSLTNKTHTKHGQFRQSLRSTCPITNHVQYLQITNRDLPQHPKLTADICTISHKCISYQNHGLFCFNLCQAWNTITNKLLQFSSVTTALSKCHHWTPEKNVHSVSNKTSKWSTDSHWGKKKHTHTHTQTQTATPKCRYKQVNQKTMDTTGACSTCLNFLLPFRFCCSLESQFYVTEWKQYRQITIMQSLKGLNLKKCFFYGENYNVNTFQTRWTLQVPVTPSTNSNILSKFTNPHDINIQFSNFKIHTDSVVPVDFHATKNQRSPLICVSLISYGS